MSLDETSGSQISRLGWYACQAAAISSAEAVRRIRDHVWRTLWLSWQATPAQLRSDSPSEGERSFAAVLTPGTAPHIPEEARTAVLFSAERLLRGEWDVLGVVRTDLIMPDWFYDPVTGRRSVQEHRAFRLGRRSKDRVSSLKQVWELSRLQHLTLLATAWFLTHDERYAQRVAGHLRSWWGENPVLSGVNWTNGIELGIRLISLAWIRRLLADWSGVADLFERDEVAVHQIRWHQQYLAALTNRGSSVSNHMIAEAAGQLVASCAFPWFRESERWRRKSALLIERELARNTFPSGVCRELALDHLCFIAELGLIAAVEADASGHPLSADTWQRLCAMVDSAAALVDGQLRPPLQGDSHEHRALLLDAPDRNCWPSLLALGEVLLGRLDWWPRVTANAGSSIVGALAYAKLDIQGRPLRRPSRFSDAGLTLLRTAGEDFPEIWCRCDRGQHTYLSVAAHANALSVEIRYAGVDILAAPGTYYGHDEHAWRGYFRSAIAHCTAELSGRSLPSEGGPFLWLRNAQVREIEVIDDGDIASWTAQRDGCARLNASVPHRRSVLLDRASRSIDIIDETDGGRDDIRLAFHLGPEVQAELHGSCAVLNWATAPAPGSARLELPPELRWWMHRGETEHILGWYSPGSGRRVRACTLLGRGRCLPGMPLITRIEFLDVGKSAQSAISRRDISWTTSVALPERA